MRFDVKKENGKIIVEVELPHQRRSHPIIERQRFQTEDVLEELKLRKIKHGKTIQAASVKNWREHTRQGTWIFEEKAIKLIARYLLLTNSFSSAATAITSAAKIDCAGNGFLSLGLLSLCI